MEGVGGGLLDGSQQDLPSDEDRLQLVKLPDPHLGGLGLQGGGGAAEGDQGGDCVDRLSEIMQFGLGVGELGPQGPAWESHTAPPERLREGLAGAQMPRPSARLVEDD